MDTYIYLPLKNKNVKKMRKKMKKFKNFEEIFRKFMMKREKYCYSCAKKWKSMFKIIGSKPDDDTFDYRVMPDNDTFDYRVMPDNDTIHVIIVYRHFLLGFASFIINQRNLIFFQFFI